MAKEITIIKHRKGRTTEYTGTVAELSTEVFNYLLECGNSWNPKISRHPKTAKSLVNALNKSVTETQGGCYEQDYYELSM